MQVYSRSGNTKPAFYSKGTEQLRFLQEHAGGSLMFYDSCVRWFAPNRKVSVTARVEMSCLTYTLETSQKSTKLDHFDATKVLAWISKELSRELH